MESRPSFFGDQDVFKEDLNQVILYVDDQFVLRQQSVLGYSGGFANGSGSVLGGGVFGSPVDYLLGKNLRTIQGATAGILSMYSGIALDQNGYLIQLNTEGMDGGVLSMTLGGSSDMYSWSSSPSVLNYIKIAYQESSGSVGSDDLGGSHATRFIPSIYATVDSTPPTSDEILLAMFTATVTGEIDAGVVNDKRLYVRTITPASAVILDPITKPVGGWTSVEDHVNAKGSAVQTNTNPHGLTGADIGLSDTVAPHVLNSHSSGIVAIDGIYDSGVYASFTPSPVDLGAEVVIQFTPPNNAGILVGGYVYTDSIAEISLLNTTLFAEGDGFYNVYMNASGSVLATKSNIDANDPPNVFKLCLIERAGAGSEYTDFYDYRTFRGTRINNIRGQDGETASIAALTRESSLSNNLARIRYQLGRAISGIGSQWSYSTPPLTAGASSNADNYHMHTRTPQANYTINYDGVTGDLENMSLRFYRGALHGNASLYWDKDADVFKLFSTEVTNIYSNLYVNSIMLQSNGLLFVPTGSVNPELRWKSDWFHLYSDSTISDYADLKLNFVDVGGEIVDAASVQKWNNIFDAGELTDSGAFVADDEWHIIQSTLSSSKFFLKCMFTVSSGSVGPALLEAELYLEGPLSGVDVADDLVYYMPTADAIYFKGSLSAIVSTGYTYSLRYKSNKAGDYKIYKV